MAVSSTPRGADIPRLTIDRDGHRQVAFHCSTAGIYIMACPPRNTRQQSPACHHRAIPQSVAACARCTAIPRPAGPPRPGRPGGAADSGLCLIAPCAPPFPPGILRRQALSVPLRALPVGRPSRRGPRWRRGCRLPVEDAPRRPRQVGKTTADRPAWCRCSCPWPDRGRGAVPHRTGRRD